MVEYGDMSERGAKKRRRTMYREYLIVDIYI